MLYVSATVIMHIMHLIFMNVYFSCLGAAFMKLAEIFTKRLKHRMIELDLDQKSLAERMHLQQPRISRYLGGKNEPSFDVIESFSSALEVSPTWLLSEEDTPIREVPSTPPTEEQIASLILGKMLSNGDRKRLAQFILTCREEELESALIAIDPIMDQAREIKSSSL